MFEQQFLVYKEVAETKNFTLAAKRLHMSQSSISLQIQNLENQYGARFFDRTNKGVSLTKAGEIFYDKVREVLNILNNAQQEVSELVEDARSVINLGATLTIGEYILPNILPYLYKERPELDIKANIANTESIEQGVLERKLHIGLIEGPVPRQKELVAETFLQDELVVVVPYFHPWASRKSVTLAELTEERLVTREEGSGTRKVMEIALEERGLDPSKLNVTMELGSTQAIKQVVAAGLGITMISALTLQRKCDHNLFRTLKIQDSPVYRNLSIITPAHSSQTKDERFFINLLHDRELLLSLINEDYCAMEMQCSDEEDRRER